MDRETGLLLGEHLDGEVWTEEMGAACGKFKDGEGGKVDDSSGVVGADVEGDDVGGGRLEGWKVGSLVDW